MVIHIVERKATERELEEMLEALGSYIKLAVDIERGVLAGGGELHADCEAYLLESGSRSDDVWGADWIPETQEVRFEALINIRPRLGNRFDDDPERRDPKTSGGDRTEPAGDMTAVARLSRIRIRYMQDAVPTRLGGLAANLARISSFAGDGRHRRAVEDLLVESEHFIEWTASEAPVAQQERLVDLQVALAEWRLRLARKWDDASIRGEVVEWAKTVSDDLLEMSGLLTYEKSR